MMTLERFKSLADSYGGRIERWPSLTRQDAFDLLTRSAAAREVLEDARELDAAIARADEAQDARSWPPGETGAAMVRLRARVAARIAARESAQHGPRIEPKSFWAKILLKPLQPGWGGLVTGGVLAVAAGLVIGLLSTSTPPPGNVLLLLEPTPLQIFTDSPR